MASEEQNKLLRERIALTKELKEAEELYIANIKKYQELLDSGVEEKNLELILKAIQVYEKKEAQIETINEKLQELKKAQDDLTSSTDSVAEKIGGLLNLQKDYNETLTSSVVASVGSAEGQAKLAESMKKTFSASNIAAMAIEEVIIQSIELTKAQDAAAVQFAKNGGNIRLYKDEVLALERSLFTSGVTTEEAAEAFLAVNNVFTDLRNVSESTRKDIVETTAMLQELGVASDITAGNLQFMTKVLGTSAEQAAQTQRELFVLARTIDMPPEAMASAFSEAMPALAAFGSESTEVFKRLQVNARSAGMEVSDVLSIVEKFDTFDTAAESVGRLNAILGGPFLNSLEMVTVTDPTERMRMLSDAVNSAGLAFDDMSYYQRRALADAMGMDIPQLALLMRDGFEQAVPTAQMSQAEMANLAEEAREFQTVMDELKQTGMLLAQSLMPLVEILKNTMQLFQSLTTLIPGFTDKILPPLIVGLGALTLAIKLNNDQLQKNILIAGATALAMILMSDATLPMKALLAGVTIGVIALTAAMTGLNISTGGLLWAIGAIVTGLVMLAQVIWHKSASPGMIDSVGALGGSFNNLTSDLSGTATAFGSLKGQMIDTAEAAHKLDGTKVEMQTKVSATSGAAVGAASTRIRMASDQQAETLSAAARPMSVAQGNSKTNVNIKLDDSSLVKLIVKTVEEVNNYRDSGLKANPNVVKNRVA